MWLHVLVLMASQAWDSHDESESSNSVFQQEHAQENPHQGNASQATSETFYNGIVNTARLLIKRLTYFGIKEMVKYIFAHCCCMHRATVFVTKVTLRQSLTQSPKVTPSSQRFNSIVLVKSIIIFLVFFVKTPSYRGTLWRDRESGQQQSLVNLDE